MTGRRKPGRCRRAGQGAEKPEKRWRLLYLRSEKLSRAKQLGKEYPRRTLRQVLDAEQFLESDA